MVADWSDDDPVIAQTIFEFKRASIPFAIMVPADPSKSVIILPEVFTDTSPVLEAIEQAIN